MNTVSINRIAKYLGVQDGKISEDNEQIVKINAGGQEYSGAATVILKLAEKSKRNSWVDREQECLVYQWLEFASLYGSQSVMNQQNGKVVLKELNNFLENCSYLVGSSRTLADVVIYHLVYEFVASLSPMEKEAFMNFSRWFDHIQQDQKVRQDNSLINFSTIYISSRAAGRH